MHGIVHIVLQSSQSRDRDQDAADGAKSKKEKNLLRTKSSKSNSGNSDLHQVLERVDRGAWCCRALAATFAFLALAFVPFASGAGSAS